MGETLLILERAYGPEHRLVAQVLARLAEVAEDERKYEQALYLRQQVLQIDTRALPDHPQIAEDKIGLARVLAELGRGEEARENLREALAAYESVFGTDHPVVARIRVFVAQSLTRLEDYQGAIGQLNSAVRSFAATADMKGEQVWALTWLAGIHRLTDYPSAAQAALESAIALAENTRERSSDLGCVVLTLAYVQQDKRDVDGARANLARALSLLDEHDGDETNGTGVETDLPPGLEPLTREHLAIGRCRQGDLLLSLGRLDEALTEYRTGLELARMTSMFTDNVPLHFRLGFLAARLGKREDALGHLTAGADLLREQGVKAPIWTLRTAHYATLIELAGPSEEVERILDSLG